MPLLLGLAPLPSLDPLAPFPAFAAGVRTATFEPDCNLSNPSVTTFWAGWTPEMAETSPSLARIFTFCDFTVPSGWTTYTKAASLLRWTADWGTRFTWVSVLTSKRAFTN